MENSRDIKNHLISFSIITILSFLTCRNLLFNEGFPFGTDSLHFVAGITEMIRMIRIGVISSWNPHEYMGIFMPVGIFWWLFSALSSLFVASPFDYQSLLLCVKIAIFLEVLLAGLAMYCLSYYLTKSYVGASVSSLAYMYSSWLLAALSEGHYDITLGIALLPLVVMTFEQMLKTLRLKQVILFSLTYTMFLSASLLVIGMSLFIISLRILLEFFTSFKVARCKELFKTLFIAFCFCAVLSAYNIVPRLCGAMSQTISVSYSIEQAYAFTSPSMLNAIIFSPRFCYPNYLLASAGQALIPIFAFGSLFFKRDRHTMFFSALALFSIFLALGPYGMGGSIFGWLWLNIPGYSAYRVSGRFLIMRDLSYACLLGITLSSLQRKLTAFDRLAVINLKKLSSKHTEKLMVHLFKNSRYFLIFLVASSIVLNGWAGITLGIGSYTWPSEYTKPYEWIKEREGNFRILTVPFQTYAYYPWLKQIDANVLPRATWAITNLCGAGYIIHDKDQLVGTHWTLQSSRTDRFLSYIKTIFEENRADEIGKLLGLANVKYIVIEPDADTSSRAFFKRAKDLVEVYHEGNAVILENTHFLPRVFATSAYSPEINCTSLDTIFSTPQTAQVSFTRTHPYEYVVHVRAEAPFWLIFSESYDPLWRAYVGSEEMQSVVAYSFLNGFYINKTGEFDLRIWFLGQTYANIGWTISIVAFTIVLVYLIYPKLRGKAGSKVYMLRKEKSPQGTGGSGYLPPDTSVTSV
jgi:hypothetical protein